MYYIESTSYSIRQRETAKKGTVYDVIFRVIDENGIQHQKVLSGFETRKKAEKAYTAFVTKQCSDKPVNLDIAKARVSFEQAYRDYRASVAGVNKESSVVVIETSFNNYILPTFGKRDLETIKEADIYRWIDEMLARRKPNGDPYTRIYVTGVYRRFRAFYSWAVLRYNVINPFARVHMPRGVQKAAQPAQIEFWTRDEFLRFIATVDDPTYRALFTLLFYTGIRKGEAFALAPGDYDGRRLRINKTYTNKTTDGSTWKITTNKTSYDHTIPLAAPARRALDEYIDQTNPSGRFLFGGDRPMAPESVRRAFGKYSDVAGVKRIRVHALRHSFVSMCIHHGANYTVVASLIGDQPEQVLKTYGHMWSADKDAIVALLD